MRNQYSEQVDSTLYSVKDTLILLRYPLIYYLFLFNIELLLIPSFFKEFPILKAIHYVLVITLFVINLAISNSQNLKDRYAFFDGWSYLLFATGIISNLIWNSNFTWVGGLAFYFLVLSFLLFHTYTSVLNFNPDQWLFSLANLENSHWIYKDNSYYLTLDRNGLACSQNECTAIRWLDWYDLHKNDKLYYGVTVNMVNKWKNIISSKFLINLVGHIHINKLITYFPEITDSEKWKVLQGVYASEDTSVILSKYLEIKTEEPVLFTDITENIF